MATSQEYIDFVCEQIKDVGQARYRKMFGEYMIYVNDKPIILVCNNTVFVKKLAALDDKMQNAESSVPYKGAKEHYILDMEDKDFCNDIIEILEKITAVPKPRKKPVKQIL